MERQRAILRVISGVTAVLFLCTNIVYAEPWEFSSQPSGMDDSCLAMDVKQQLQRVLPQAVALATPLLFHSEFAKSDIKTLSELNRNAHKIREVLVKNGSLSQEEAARYSFLLFKDTERDKRSYYYFNKDGYFFRVSEEAGIRDPFYVAFLDGLGDRLEGPETLNGYHFEKYKISPNNARAIHTAVSRLVEAEVPSASAPSVPANRDFLGTYVPHLAGYGLPGVNDVIREAEHDTDTGQEYFHEVVSDAARFLGYRIPKIQIDLVTPRNGGHPGFLGLVFISPQIWQYVHAGMGTDGQTCTVYIPKSLYNYLTTRYKGVDAGDTRKYSVYITALVIHEVVELFGLPHFQAQVVHRRYLGQHGCGGLDEFGNDELEGLLIDLTREYVETLDKPIFEPINKWEDIFKKMAEEDPNKIATVSFILHLKGEETRVFTYGIPINELQAGRLSPFVEHYLKTQLCNLLTSMGAEKVGIGTSLSDDETEKLVSWANKTFPVPEEEVVETDESPGYRHIASRLSHVYRVRGSIFYKAGPDDLAKYLIEEAKGEEEAASAEDFRRIKELKGVNIGIDAGGTDVKVVVYKDGEMVFSKKHNWRPEEFLDAEKHIETVEYLIRLAVVAVRLKELTPEERVGDMARLVKRFADIVSDTPIEEIKDFVGTAQVKLDIGVDSGYMGIDSIGISWPDTVVDAQVMAEAAETRNVGLAAAARIMAERHRIDISGYIDQKAMVDYVVSRVGNMGEERQKEFKELRQRLYRREIRRRIRPIAEVISSRFGNIPVAIAEDANIGAFWTAVNEEEGNVVGIVMGTNTAIGSVDKKGRIRRFLTNMDKLVVNMTRSDAKTAEELTGILGAASRHLSQQGVIRLAEEKGLALAGFQNDAEKLRYIQSLLDSESGDLRAKAEGIFDEIGVFLASAISQIYYYFNKSGTNKYVLFGRVVEGKAGDRIKASAGRELTRLAEKYQWLGSVRVRLEREVEGGKGTGGMATGAAYHGYQKMLLLLREMVGLIVEDATPFTAIKMIFEGRYKEGDIPIMFTKVCNGLIEVANKDNIRYIRFFLEYAIRASYGMQDAAIAQSVQAISGQVSNIISWIERDVPGAGAMRVTCNEHEMVTNKERGRSYLKKDSLPVEVTDREGRPGFYWRGSEGIAKIECTLLKGAMYDESRKEENRNKMVAYTMNHGFMRVPDEIRGLTEDGKISTIHETSFINDYIPGSLQVTSTGKGHYQGAKLDIKHVTGGEGIQFNVRFDTLGDIAEVRAQYLKKGSWTAALPGYVDYMVNLGGLRFNDISVELDEGTAQRFNGAYRKDNDGKLKGIFEATHDAPYKVVRTCYKEVEQGKEASKVIYLIRERNIRGIKGGPVEPPGIHGIHVIRWFDVTGVFHDNLLDCYSHLTEDTVGQLIGYLHGGIVNSERPPGIEESVEPAIASRVGVIQGFKGAGFLELQPYPVYGDYGSNVLQDRVRPDLAREGHTLAEVWLNSDRRIGLSRIKGTAVEVGWFRMPDLTLRELLELYPEMVGKHPDQPHKPLGVRICCTRFSPDMIMGVNADLQDIDGFIERLKYERREIEKLHRILDIKSENAFNKFKRNYETWVQRQAQTGWAIESFCIPELLSFVNLDRCASEGLHQVADFVNFIDGIRKNRAELMKVFNRISLSESEVVIIPAGQVHESSGLSLHAHPGLGVDARNEASIAIPVGERDGERFYVEVCQPFSGVYSIADFHMPIVWDKDGKKTRMRKDITADMIEEFVRERIIHKPSSPDDFVLDGRFKTIYENEQFGAKLEKILQGPYEGAGWKDVYFIVDRISLKKPGSGRHAQIEIAPIPSVFYELVVTVGKVKVDIKGEPIELERGHSIYIPADATDRVTITTEEPEAQVLMFYKPSLIINEIASLVEALIESGIDVSVRGRHLKDLLSSPVDLYKCISAFTPLSNPENIKFILQARLDVHNGRAPPEMFQDAETVRKVYNALFLQDELKRTLEASSKPVKIVLLRGGTGASKLTEELSKIDGVNVTVVLSGTDDGRSWFHAAREFNATGVPDCGKSLLDLANRETADEVYILLKYRLEPKPGITIEEGELKKQFGFLVRKLNGEELDRFSEVISLPMLIELEGIALELKNKDSEKFEHIVTYLTVFMQHLDQSEFSDSKFSLINVCMRNVVILGAAWYFEATKTVDNYWQKAVDTVAVLLDVKEGSRVLLATKERVHLMAMTRDGTIFFTETGINEYKKGDDFVGVWLVERAVDIDAFTVDLITKSIELQELSPDDEGLARVPEDKKPEIIETVRKINLDGLSHEEKDRIVSKVARKIAGMSLTDLGDPQRHVRITQEVKEALEGADAIVYCPTTMESNLGSTLLVEGVREAIRSNRKAVKVYFVNPTIENDKKYTTAFDILERFYRCMSNQQGYRLREVVWEDVGSVLEKVVGMAMQWGRRSSEKEYIPFDKKTIDRELRRHGVEPIGLHIEEARPTVERPKDYGGSPRPEWGYYSEDHMTEVLLMLWALKDAGFGIEAIGEEVQRQRGGTPSPPAMRGPIGKRVDKEVEYSELWQAGIKDGRIGEGSAYGIGERHPKYSRIKKDILQELLAQLISEFGPGILGVVDAVRIVDNIDAEKLRKGRNGIVPYTMMITKDGKNILLVDVDAFPEPGADEASIRISKIVMYINLVHEFEESIMTVVPYESEGVRELAMNFRSIKFVLGLIKEGRVDVEQIMERLPGLGADIQFLEAVRVLNAMGEVTDNNIVAVALEHMRNMPYYKDFFEEFGFARDWAGEVERLGNRYQAAVKVFSDIMEARIGGDAQGKEKSQKELKKAVEGVEVNIKVVETFTGRKRIASGLETFSRQLQRIIGVSAKGIWGREGMKKGLEEEASKRAGEQYWIVLGEELQRALETGVGVNIIQKQIDALKEIKDSGDRPLFNVVYSIGDIPKEAFSTERPRVIRLVDFEGVNDIDKRIDILYLPTVYTSGSVYLAAHLVLAGGRVDQIGDSMVKGILMGLCRALCEGREEEGGDLYNLLFRKPWEVVRITEQLDALNIAIIQIEKAA